MKKKSLICIAVLLIIAISAMVAVSYLPENRGLTAMQKEKLASTYSSYMSKMSGVAYVVHHEDVIFDEGSGMATGDKENSSDLAYSIASLTKQFTAACIMQLYENGKLDIEDTLARYFPDYEYSYRIKIKHLLCQRSGIPDYSVDLVNRKAKVTCYMDNGKGVVIKKENSSKENRDIIRDYVFSQRLLFRPGDRFDYSDSNFSLLADIVEMASGESYHDYVREHIFQPLGMETSAFIDDNDLDEDIIVQTDDSEFADDYYLYKGVEFGCGDILSSPKDLYLWYKGFVGGKVVTRQSYDLMTKNYSDKDEQGYGFGLMISDKSDSKVVYHYGWIPSFYSAVFYIPDYDYFQLLITNRPDGDPHRMAAQMAYRFGETVELKLKDID